MKKIFVFVIALSIFIFAAGCGKKDVDYNYGEKNARASGVISKDDTGVAVQISDILAEVGDDIDYTSDIEFENVPGDAFVQISVDAGAVDIWEPGTYEVAYTIMYDDMEINRISHVTVKEKDSAGTSGKPASSNASGNPSANQAIAPNDSAAETKEKDIGSATIELLSGGTAVVKQTNYRFIQETYTDNTTIEKNGSKYNVSKLIVLFNTGEKQVLETIERPAW